MEQHRELCRTQMYHAVADRWPGEAPLVQPLVTQLRTDFSNAPLQFVRVTHPFHPLFGPQLPCVGKRYNRYGERLLLQVDDATVWSVPPQWTDLWDPDPEVIMGGGRALGRAVELMELASLVRRLSDKLSARPSKNV